MLDETAIEQRLAALERAVARIERRLITASADENWVEKMSGSISDEETLMKVAEYGREWRHADRPPDEPSDEP